MGTRDYRHAGRLTSSAAFCPLPGAEREHGKASRFSGNRIVDHRLLLDIGDSCARIWPIARMDRASCRVGNIYGYTGVDDEAKNQVVRVTTPSSATSSRPFSLQTKKP